jgi:hypothetical protein
MRRNVLAAAILAGSVSAAMIGAPMAPAEGVRPVRRRDPDPEPESKIEAEREAPKRLSRGSAYRKRNGGEHQHNREIERRLRQAERRASKVGGG